MMARLVTVEQAQEVLSRHYTRLGKVCDLRVLDVPVVSSAIFRFETCSGIYCLKVPLYSKVKSVAGSENELLSWQLIGTLRQKLFDNQPEYALLLSWHIGQELSVKLSERGFKGKFIVPLPEPRVL